MRIIKKEVYFIDKDSLIELHAKGYSNAHIARLLRVSRPSVGSALKRLGLIRNGTPYGSKPKYVRKTTVLKRKLIEDILKSGESLSDSQIANMTGASRQYVHSIKKEVKNEN